MPALQQLVVKGCDISNRQGVARLSWDALPALTELKIDVRLHNTEVLRTLQTLGVLDVHVIYGLADLEPLGELHALKRLSFWRCFDLNDLTPLSKLPQLESLEIIYCKAVQDLEPLASHN